MIEVTIWCSSVNGDGARTFLIDVKTDSAPSREYFAAAQPANAIRRALVEFEKDPVTSRSRITRIDVRTTPDKVLILEP